MRKFNKNFHNALTAFFSIAVAVTLLFVSCKGKDNVDDAELNSDSSVSSYSYDNNVVYDSYSAEEIVEKRDIVYEEYKFIDPKDAFKLDYRPEAAEPASVPGKLRFEVSEGSMQQTTHVIPGLRDLSNYKISYLTKKMSISDFLAQYTPVNPTSSSTAEPQPVQEAGNLYVKDWGPAYSVPGEMAKPTFYIRFSLPVKDLSALQDQSVVNREAAGIFTISPAVKGNYRWLGTDCLSFECDEPLDITQEYTITVNNSVKSIGGKRIGGQLKYTTQTAPVRLNSVEAGVRANTERTYYSGSGVPLESARYAMVYFNSYLSVNEIKSMLTITSANKGTLSFNVSLSSNTISTSAGNKARAAYISINETLDRDDKVTYTLYDSTKNISTKGSYDTLKTFVNTDKRNRTGQGYGLAATFSFNQPIDESSVKNAVSISGGSLGDDSIKVRGSNLEFRYVKPSSTSSSVIITINTNLLDIAGGKLKNSVSITLEQSEYQTDVTFLTSGHKMMEAQYPHKLIFEYINADAEGSGYEVKSVSDPLGDYWDHYKYNPSAPGNFPLSHTERNVKNYEEIDLDPYLKNGKGFVAFNANIKGFYYSYWNHERQTTSFTNSLVIQVTDLGATVRYGANKAVVVVRSLSTNKAVAGANVEFSTSNGVLNAKTDSKGIAIIEIPEDDWGSFYKYGNSSWSWENPTVKVSYNGDAIWFVPSDHSSYRSGISTSNPYAAVKESSHIFMFTDRGLYKPGETVTFRAIDRTQKLGSFIPYHGDVRFTLSRDSYYSSFTVGSYVTNTSNNGGSWGKFDLPEDLEPGQYKLSYSRVGSEGARSIYITVAEFEPLKIQGELTMSSNSVTFGQNVSANYQASYLAGGYLAGAEYRADWYRSPASFYAPKFSKYSFESEGFYDYDYYYDDYDDYMYDSSTLVSSEYGTLDATGKAVLSTSTDDITSNRPYTYRLEVSATDVSNQRITTTAATMVHPASFYMGLSKPSNITSFPKKGQALQIPFVLVTPDQEVLEDLTLASESISYTLTRSYWTSSTTRDSDGDLYTSWTRKEDEEKSGVIKTASSGKIVVTPNEGGYYKLALSTTDSEGRTVSCSRVFYVTASNVSYYNSNNSLQIALTPDQSMYNPGDTAHILMESPLPAGDYLITVEREGIYTEEVKHFTESCNVIDIPIARNYVPVVYVSVSSYSERTHAPTHEWGQSDTEKPRGYYGVTALNIDSRVRAFSINVETSKKVYRPGEKASVTVTATKGGVPLEGAEITLMAADRAVLDLIDYHVSDPIPYFYNRGNFPLSVRGGDSRAYLMDPVTYSIKNLQGGDASDLKEEERKDFKPTAFFEPELITDKNGKATLEFVVPSNLTTFRVTAFGVNGELLALQEDEFGVQNPLNVQAVQPKKLRERDTAECGVLITNVDSEPHDVTVTIDIRAPEGNYEELEEDGYVTVGGNAFVDGPTTHTVKVGAGMSSAVYFDVAATEQGNIEFVYTVRSDVLNEKLVSKMSITKTYSTETVALYGATDYISHSTATETQRVSIPSWSEDGFGNIKVTLDATRLGALGTSVRYVFDYPHGCMEQQSSRVQPLVMFGDYIDVFGLSSEVSNPHKVVTSFFRSWKKVQLPNGGFPYWPDGNKDNFYVSLRILNIYAAAVKNGYKESELYIDKTKLKNYVKNYINSTSYITDFQKAYACYIFELLGDHSLSSTLEQLEQIPNNSLGTASYIGLAYVEKGDMTRAQKYRDYIKSYMRPTGRSVDITSPSRYSYWYSTYDGDKALMLMLMSKVDPSDQMIDKLLYNLLTNQGRHGYWSNTDTTARVLDSIATYIKARKLETTSFDAVAELAGVKIVDGHFEGAGAKPVSNSMEFTSKELSGLSRDTALNLDFKVNGTGTLFYTTEMTYALPDEIQSERSEGIEVKYHLYDWDTGKEVMPERDSCVINLESGKVYKVVVDLSSNHYRDYIAVRVPVPSGAEILDSRFKTTGSDAIVTNSRYSRMTIYGNEVDYYWNSFYGRGHLEFTFRASRRGVYPTTPVSAECMYEPEVFGRTDGYLFTIR